VEDVQHVDLLRRTELVEDGEREPSQGCSPDVFVSGNDGGAAREDLEACEEAIQVLDQILIERRPGLLIELPSRPDISY
jgi:hypothetical protein